MGPSKEGFQKAFVGKFSVPELLATVTFMGLFALGKHMVEKVKTQREQARCEVEMTEAFKKGGRDALIDALVRLGMTNNKWHADKLCRGFVEKLQVEGKIAGVVSDVPVEA
jgi:hypothetical protein